jgi:hypothetical protein
VTVLAELRAVGTARPNAHCSAEAAGRRDGECGGLNDRLANLATLSYQQLGGRHARLDARFPVVWCGGIVRKYPIERANCCLRHALPSTHTAARSVEPRLGPLTLPAIRDNI